MNQSLTLAFLIAAGIGLVVQNTLMVRITQTSSTILIAMLLNSLVGIVLFVSILWFKQGMAGFGELVSSVRWWTLIPGLLGSFFVFASISCGMQIKFHPNPKNREKRRALSYS